MKINDADGYFKLPDLFTILEMTSVFSSTKTASKSRNFIHQYSSFFFLKPQISRRKHKLNSLFVKLLLKKLVKVKSFTYFQMPF